MNEVADYARNKLAAEEQGSPKWFYYRGILLGIESTESKLVSIEWVEAVFQCNQRKEKTS